MEINVQFRPQRQEDRSVQLGEGATVQDLMETVGEVVDITVAVRGNTPIAEDEPLVAGETILLLSAASGG